MASARVTVTPDRDVPERPPATLPLRGEAPPPIRRPDLTVPPLGDPAIEAKVAGLIVAKAGADPTARAADPEPLEAFARLPLVEELNPRDRRRALEAHAAGVARAALVAAAKAGATAPDPTIPVEAIANYTLAPVANPNGVARLVERVREGIDRDAAELQDLAGRIAHAPAWHQALAPLVERQSVLEARLPRRRAALDRFASAFAAGMASAIGKDADVIVSGVYESLAHATAAAKADPGNPGLQARPRLPEPPPALSAAEAERDDIARQLDQLGTVGRIAPGAVAAKLKARKAELEGRIKTLGDEHAARVEAEIRDQVARAAGGDKGAWASICSALAQCPDAFPGDLAARLHGVAADAFAKSDPELWADALVASIPGGAGLEF